MEFKKLLKFVELQEKRLKKLYPDVTDPEKRTFAHTIKLSEEFGELCNEILANSSLQRKDKMTSHKKEKLLGEFADVIITTLIVAKSMNVDIEKALDQKIKELNKRFK